MFCVPPPINAQTPDATFKCPPTTTVCAADPVFSRPPPITEQAPASLLHLPPNIALNPPSDRDWETQDQQHIQ